MSAPTLDGLFGIKIPVADLPSALAWYQRVFGAQVDLEFPDDSGVVRGVACSVPGMDGTCLALREDPDAARGVAGFNLALWGVTGRDDIESWASHLDDLGIEHSPTIEASVGWVLIFHDPEGLEHHLYTRTRHGVDHSGRAGRGRVPVPTG